jgi:hypothetical protein
MYGLARRVLLDHLADPTSRSIQYDKHPLDSAPSPLLRALPAFERQFRAHVHRANAFAEAGKARLALSDRLLTEMVRLVLPHSLGSDLPARPAMAGGSGICAAHQCRCQRASHCHCGALRIDVRC